MIVTYNSSGYLERCLASLRSEGTVITVVDNSVCAAERDRTAAIVAAHGSEYVATARNTGFGAGVNLGVAVAGPGEDDWIWLLNPDTEVTPGCVDALVEAAETLQAQLLSPLITMGADRTRVWFAGGDLDLRKGFCAHRQYGAHVSEVSPSPVQCSFLTGAALFVSASLWSALGGMREDLFLYWEDADLSHRAVQFGAVLTTVPRARVWHRVGGSGGDTGMNEWYHYYMQRNRQILASECLGSAWRALRRTAPMVVRSLLLAIFREESGRAGKAAASVRGTVDGVKAARRARGGEVGKRAGTAASSKRCARDG